MPDHPIIPPAPKVHAKDLPSWRLIIGMTRNMLGVWPDHAFDVLVSRSKVLGLESLLVNDPDAVRQVMGAAASRYRRPIAVTRPVRPLAGAGLLLSEGQDWRRQRRMLAPVFNPSSIGALLPHFTAAADGLVRRLERQDRANLSDAYHDTALDAVLRALFSVTPQTQNGALAAMVRGYITHAGRPNILDGLAKVESDFPFASGSRRAFQKAWFAQVDALVAQRRSQPRGDDGRDLLDLLLSARDPETGAPLDDAEIRDQSATMLFAGFETTSRLLFWASYLICLDPAEQTRLRAEVAAFPPERVTSLEDLQNWPRLRNTLLEALRLYPPAPTLVREAIEADTVMGEEVQPGVQVWMSAWVMHRHRKFWDRPTAFMPDRFAGQTSPWTSGAFVPFGAGPRICIGAGFSLAEAQIILATQLSRFEISLADDRPVLPVALVTTGPDHEPWFKLARI